MAWHKSGPAHRTPRARYIKRLLFRGNRVPTTLIRVTAAAIALGALAIPAAAQCPDGTPMPCSPRVVARAPVAPPSSADRSRRFMVLPFRNLSRAAEQEWLVEGSTTMLSDALGRWQGITVVPDEKLYPALKRAGIAPGSVIDAPRVRRVAEETGGWTAVTGEVIATGGRLRISARAWDVPTDRELVRASGEVPAGGDVRAAFDSVSLRLLRSAGLDSITPDLAEATTHNLDAYRAYLRGLAHLRRSELKDALAEFQAAVRADSSFALGWARLADAMGSSDPVAIFNPINPGAQAAARAVALSAKLPPRLRELVRAIDAQFRAQFGEGRRALESMLAADSNDVDALQELADLESVDPVLLPVGGGAGMRPRGSPNRAVYLAKRAVTLDPGRFAMYGLLARIYVLAGIPGGSATFGISREVSSVQDMMQLAAQPGQVRFYLPVLRGDSLALVPAESLAAIPKDSLRASQRQARSVARAWAERWVTATTGEAAPYQMLAGLYAFDDEYPAALRAVAKAESLGVQDPGWSPAARRVLFLAKGGELDAAARLADSLSAARFFADRNHGLTNLDAAAWIFALDLRAGRVAQAEALLDQISELVRQINPRARPNVALQNLMGNLDPEDEPRIPRAFRQRQLEAALARLDELSASAKLGPWIPLLLPQLASAIDSAHRTGGDLLKAANTLASAGNAGRAFELASNTVFADSTLETTAAAYPWYRSGLDALNATRGATQARFHAGSASVLADRVSFQWKVDDASPFTWSRPETPVGRQEYRWEVTLEAGGRYYRMMVAPQTKSAMVAPESGSLGELLGPTAARFVLTGALGAGAVQSDTTLLQGTIVQTETGPGVLRMSVTDRGLLEWIRRERPQQARFRFYPCVNPIGAASQCVDEQVTISYP
jgi:TolB-like protein/tetratricopeptide (TPR) repeat protein